MVVCNTEHVMKKFLINLVCCFVPSRKMRHRIRGFAKRVKTHNNTIEIIKTDGRRVRVRRVPGCKFVFTGDNNHIVLHEPIGKLELIVRVSSGVYVELQPSTVYQRKIKVYKSGGEGKLNKLLIGRDFSSTGWVVFDFCCGGGDITIGDDCLFADGVFWTGDFHVIRDKKTGRILNHNADIVVGRHVWLGTGVKVLKRACIPDNAIVGAHSLVTHRFDAPNVVLAGVPAKVVKTDVDWERAHPDMC